MDEIQRFEQLVSRRAGISLREQERTTLRNLLQSRLSVLGLRGLDGYHALLESGSAAGEAEWTQMFSLLTNNETYFFRDSGQLELLRERILPELIEANRAHRTLRIWSAGCSTGEEPYSLAMILDEVLGLQRGWKVLILGTDLSEAALKKARAGIYSAWSFRAMKENVRERYFSPVGRRVGKGFERHQAPTFRLHPRVANAVTFKQNNLWSDPFPSHASELHNMDLIVCRNVFIYFSRPAVAAVLGKFRYTLRSGGYLMTGHAELHDTHLHGLEPRTFPQTVIYQAPHQDASRLINTCHSNAHNPYNHTVGNSAFRSVAQETDAPRQNTFATSSFAPNFPSLDLDPKEETLSRDALVTGSSNSKSELADRKSDNRVAELSRVSENVASRVEEAARLVGAGRLEAALQLLLQVLEKQPTHYFALCLAAKSQANGGHHEVALEFCRRACQSEPFSPMAYELMARIEEDRGNDEAAKALLKRVIYLAPDLVWPYLEIESLYRREGDAARAQTMRRTVMKMLASLPPDTPVNRSILPASAQPVSLPTAQQVLSQLQHQDVTNNI